MSTGAGRFRVAIVGGGVAALEVALALAEPTTAIASSVVGA
jgi:uncharacterized NAD(P)/FAD-binding protein YdhS